MLNSYLKSRLNEKEILLMTHIVLGYPSFEASLQIIEVRQLADDMRVLAVLAMCQLADIEMCHLPRKYLEFELLEHPANVRTFLTLLFHCYFSVFFLRNLIHLETPPGRIAHGSCVSFPISSWQNAEKARIEQT